MKVEKKKLPDEIPTSSMADIAFLLIIYFMITTTFSARRGLDFSLPKEEKNPPPVIEKEESIHIQIKPDGSFLVDQKPMDLNDIWDYIKPKLERNPKKPIIINPDPEAPYGKMVEVFDYLRNLQKKYANTYPWINKMVITIPTRREIEAFWS